MAVGEIIALQPEPIAARRIHVPAQLFSPHSRRSL
jgi:hypothetical protein